MPLIDLGAGSTTPHTTRAVAATDSPEVAALGTPADEPPLDPVAPATVVALLKAQALALEKVLAPVLLELREIKFLLMNMR
jgi:hypothetical protein